MEDNPQAFPSLRVYTDSQDEICSDINEGMTLRDYFAAKAMQVYLEQMVQDPINKITNWAYVTADSMLEARKK